MSVEIYDPINEPTLYAMHKDMEEHPGSFQPDMWGLIFTIRELDKTIERIQMFYIEGICAKYEDAYVFSIGQMVLYLADAVRHAAIRLEQVPDDLRANVEQACNEFERLAR